MTTPQIEKLLRAVFERVRGSEDEESTRNFVFHMRDWEDDLQRIAAVYRDPGTHSEQACKEAVDGMLLHACGHIMQAARLYGGIIDPFGASKPQEK
jgi:hypothetical protein